MNRRTPPSAWNTGTNFGVWPLKSSVSGWTNGTGRDGSAAGNTAAFRRDSLYQALLSEKLSRFQQAIRHAFELV